MKLKRLVATPENFLILGQTAHILEAPMTRKATNESNTELLDLLITNWEDETI